jgi:hypothetical protein
MFNIKERNIMSKRKWMRDNSGNGSRRREYRCRSRSEQDILEEWA